MLDSFLSLKICKPTCKFISIKDYTETEPEYIKNQQFKHSTKEKMVFPIKTEELSAGTQYPSKPIPPAGSSSLPTLSDTQDTQELQSGQIEIKT